MSSTWNLISAINVKSNDGIKPKYFKMNPLGTSTLNKALISRWNNIQTFDNYQEIQTNA